MDLEMLLNKYQNVSREELEKIRDTAPPNDVIEISVRCRNQEMEIEKIQGRKHVEAGPLVQVLSVRILPDKVDENKPLMIYGRIYIEFRHIISREIIVHDLFNRGRDDPEILNSCEFLTLTGPVDTCSHHNLYMPLYQSNIIVDIWDATRHVVFAQDGFFVDDATKGDYEQVNMKIVHGTSGFLLVLYAAMPFAILCRLEVVFYQRKRHRDKGDVRHILNLNGKIVARYGNTCGNYADEEFTLFEKQSQEFEQLVIDKPNVVRLSRCWLSMPAYSSLIIDLNLFDFDTKRHIFKGVVELFPQRYWSPCEAFAIDDVVMRVELNVFSRDPGWCRVASDMQLEDKSSDDESSPDISIPWTFRRHASVLFSSPSMEVFSIFIGRQKMIKVLRLFGTIEVSSGEHLFYIFKRDEEDAFELLEHSRTVPIQDDLRVYDDDDSVGIKFNLKDVEGNLFIKGYAEWDVTSRDAWPSSYNKQLCSVIQGKNGFVALQYSFFSWAFHASIEVRYKLKKDGSFGVYGSLVAQYDTYNYSTRFKRDYYRSILFKRIQQDLVPLKIDGKLPLSRSMVVVPSDSSLIIDANLLIIDVLSGVIRQGLSSVVKIKIGLGSLSMETEDCLIDIYVKWRA